MTSTTVYSQNLPKDSIKYPIWGTDVLGTPIVTITREQQLMLNRQLLELQQLRNREQIRIEYTKQLEGQIKDYNSLEIYCDSVQVQYSDMLMNRVGKIQQLETQLRLKDILISTTEHQYKQERKKLLGWKIGTYATIGVAIVAIPLTIIILK